MKLQKKGKCLFHQNKYCSNISDVLFVTSILWRLQIPISRKTKLCRKHGKVKLIWNLVIHLNQVVISSNLINSMSENQLFLGWIRKWPMINVGKMNSKKDSNNLRELLSLISLNQQILISHERIYHVHSTNSYVIGS